MKLYSSHAIKIEYYGNADTFEDDLARTPGRGRFLDGEVSYTHLIIQQLQEFLHSISGHTDNVSALLQYIDNMILMFRKYLSKTVSFFDSLS